MLNAYVPHLNILAGRMLGGALLLSADHPFVMMGILATVAGAAGSVMLDAVAGGRHEGP